MKLAFKNVQKSFRDYSIYFLTLTLSVAFYYAFNAFEAQPSIQALSENTTSAARSLVRLVGLISVVISCVLFGLILYANQFIMNKRKKEMALYQLMGARHTFTRNLLLMENIIVGSLSLLVGIILGILFSFIVYRATVPLIPLSTNYDFKISLHSLYQTCLSFGLSFILVSIIAAFSLQKKKVINLIQAHRKNSTIKESLIITMIIFIASLTCLGFTYYWALQPSKLLKHMPVIIIMGSVSTYGLFKSFGNLLYFWNLKHRPLFFKNLNPVVFRSISSHLSTTTKIMTMICLMLLLGMGAFATTSNLSLTIKAKVDSLPYATSVISYEDSQLDGDLNISVITEFNVEELSSHNIMGYDDFKKYENFHHLDPLNIDQFPVLIVTGTHNDSMKYPEIDIANDGTARNYPNLTNMGIIDGPLFIVENLPEHSSSPLTTINNHVNEINLQSKDETKVVIQRSEMMMELQGVILLFTYVGLFVGFIFITASLALIALQQLYSSKEKAEDYLILSYMGATQSMIKKSLFNDLFLSFSLPLTLALVHTLFGLRIMEVNLALGGLNSVSFIPAILSITVCLVIYCIYFNFTYYLSYQTIQKRITEH
ncbi:MAG: FtsX-like permease family protein [Erysipelothrix sp.]